MEPVDQHFVSAVEVLRASGSPTSSAADEGTVPRLTAMFDAQATSRHLDFAARTLQRSGECFYTIGSAGHESNAALGLLSRVSDPALLHYRSGGFYAARAALSGAVDPVRETLRSLTSSSQDPISGGRHKVIGHRELSIIPQTSTIASHLPRAVGLAYALGKASLLERSTPWPHDAVVICSFGDASVNHSTATGALNAAAYLTHRHKACPILLVCEDNGIGISTRSPRGWVASTLRHQPGVPYFSAAGHDPVALLTATEEALATVRGRRSPAILHLDMVRFMAHAGSDVESAYRSPRAIEADYDDDPLLATARALVENGAWTGDHVLARYEEIRQHVGEVARSVCAEPRLSRRDEVVAPLTYGAARRAAHPSRTPSRTPRRSEAPTGKLVTLAQAINATLAQELEADPGVLVFGEDVAVKGGVYGVTRGLHRRFGSVRVFDTLLDEQTILGTALGAGLAGFLPIPEIQYLAYLHNAEDQLRGEAASLRFFSNGQYRNGMVVRIPGLAYQKGFGGHFHNDNSVAVLRDIPGLVLAVPSHPAVAPGLLRGCLDLARDDGRVCVYLEPIARYHTKDLIGEDRAWLAEFDESTSRRLGDLTTYGSGADLLLVTFGNGVFMSRRAALTLTREGIDCTVLDLTWLTPLPTAALVEAAHAAAAVLIVDETRAAGGVAEAVITALVEAGIRVPMARVASADSFVPLGPAAAAVLVQEDEVVAVGRRLARTHG
ncbi:MULTISPECIES: thiamine pyrophosphate-dependent enzyme [Nocardioides]|uniref:Thiamine pyrophosphate-dependent enzyme n=1 Tax=Nocardioides vastitatis TaxID=2568655 RepID=A0ABW0ZJF2_9ACTN|nr:thiamine pyrophosphate-dependent enzyme [Nocardioides sp.]THI98336.1 MFS transporter [Nocardioides sp.]